MVNTLVCGTSMHGFDSHIPPHIEITQSNLSFFIQNKQESNCCFNKEKMMSKFNEANKKSEKTVVGAYEKVEDAVHGTYDKIKNTIVETYKKD